MANTIEDYKVLFFNEICEKLESRFQNDYSEWKRRDAALKELEAKLTSVSEEIKDIGSGIEAVRKKAISDQDHKSHVQKLINDRESLNVLGDIKSEIEKNLIPIAKKHLDSAKTKLSASINGLLHEVAEPYQKELNECFIDLCNKISGYQAALSKLSDESFLYLSPHKIDIGIRPMLPIRRAMIGA